MNQPQLNKPQLNQPQPDRPPHGRAYQGRPLPRPQDEIVDQGLAFDVTTLLNRRRMLRVFGLSAGALALAACTTESAPPSGTTTSASTSRGAATPSGGGPSGPTGESTALTEIPAETAGPFPGDGSNGPDALEQSGVIRSDIRSSFGSSTTTAEGVTFTFDLVVLDIGNGGAPLADQAVYVWHCDRDGGYSMYSSGVENENYLRGVQITDGAGTVRFTSIFPACYPGRWPHVHFEIYPDQASIADSAAAIVTSQMALPQDACEAVYRTSGYEQSAANLSRVSLQTDNVFRDDAGIHQIATVSGDVTSGYVARLTVPIK